MGEAIPSSQPTAKSFAFVVGRIQTLGGMNTSISRLRQAYRPKDIAVLFVAESPPESSDDEVRFFYNPRQARWDHMYRAIMAAVFPEFVYHPGQKDFWLRQFQQHGYYMIDATDRPVNHLSSTERRRELNASVDAKLFEIGTLVTPSTPIVLVKKNIFASFNKPLRDAGYNVIHETFLPFPSHGHQARFIEGCRKCLRNAQRGG
ncbi:MAG: hypothetical protein WBX11_13890 [Thiobacillaceae bacterium]